MSLEKDITAIKTLIEATDKFICDQCSREFNTKTGYSEHMTRKHSGKTYDLSSHKPDCTCSFCKDKHGENNPFFGKKHSEDTKKKQAIAKQDKSYEEIYGEEEGKRLRSLRSEEGTGRLKSEQAIQKISAKLKGVPKSDAHKQKMSDVWDIGHTPEVIQKMGIAAKSKYMTGYFTSVMNHKDIFFQSSYELYTYICLEHDNEVDSYNRCNFKIPYLFDGEIHRYYPDIDIRYKDGSQKILEIKPARRLQEDEVVAKRIAAEKYCREHGMVYEMWTEEEIQAILDRRD